MDILGITIDAWVAVGFAGQFIFFARWVVQWLASEKRKEAVIPKSFWYFSIIGSIITFVYAVHRKDPVFIFSTVIGLFIFIRNLVLFKSSLKEPLA